MQYFVTVNYYFYTFVSGVNTKCGEISVYLDFLCSGTIKEKLLPFRDSLL